jgi:hypothetical protein
MRFVVAVAGFALLCACSTTQPADTAAVAPAAAKPAAAAPAAAAPAAAAPVKTTEKKKVCRRTRELGSIKYKDECGSQSDNAAAAKAGADSRNAAARAIQGAAGLGN